MRRVGRRLDLFCCFLTDRTRRCGFRQSCWEGERFQGFLKPGSGSPETPKWNTKLRVLHDLAGYADRGAIRWELLPSSGLTEGQLSGCLRRNLKNGCVARSEGKEPAPLTGAPSYRYFLTARGYVTLERVGYARQ